MPTITLTVDDADYRDIQREIAFRQRIRRPLPDGESDTAGAMFGEIVRDLWEYRGLYVRRRREEEGDHDDLPKNVPGVSDD